MAPPLEYDEATGELVNVCIDCGSGPCSTFNDRCLSCHEAHLLPRELEVIDFDDEVPC